jgi:hypothetical protein
MEYGAYDSSDYGSRGGIYLSDEKNQRDDYAQPQREPQRDGYLEPQRDVYAQPQREQYREYARERMQAGPQPVLDSRVMVNPQLTAGSFGAPSAAHLHMMQMIQLLLLFIIVILLATGRSHSSVYPSWSMHPVTAPPSG